MINGNFVSCERAKFPLIMHVQSESEEGPREQRQLRRRKASPVAGADHPAWILPALLAQGPIALAKARLHRFAALHVA